MEKFSVIYATVFAIIIVVMSSLVGFACNNNKTDNTIDYVDTSTTENKKNYIFLGSSITNGYDPTTEYPNAVSSHLSMADMMGQDYLAATYTTYRNGEIHTENSVYMRKITTNMNSEDSYIGTYTYDYDTVTLNENGEGVFNGTTFKYNVKDNEIRLDKPIDKLSSFKAKFNFSDNVIKQAKDGYTLSYKEERYTSTGDKITNKYNQSYVGLLKEAVTRYKKTKGHADKVDTLFIQISTNDMGQFTTSEATEHLPFGEVLANNKRSLSDFNTDTSFGALEWLVAEAKEIWNCQVVLFVCHMSQGDYIQFKANGYDYSKMDTASDYAKMRQAAYNVAEKWQIGIIDLWGDAEVNETLFGNTSRYLADTIHLHPVGYEKVYLQKFRNYIINTDK